jgi:hypothetical protein
MVRPKVLNLNHYDDYVGFSTPLSTQDRVLRPKISGGLRTMIPRLAMLQISRGRRNPIDSEERIDILPLDKP